MKYVYFGTPQFAATILDELNATGYLPTLIVTSPDKPAGRKLILTPSPVKKWATAHGIEVLTPEKLSDVRITEKLKEINAELFIVAAYGKIIPKSLLDLPSLGTINVHPSLLPLLRGPSPIESAITSGLTETGVTIMKLDEEMDHGPIIAQEHFTEPLDPKNPPKGSALEEQLAHEGGKLLAHILPNWISGTITAIPQDHTKATYCKKITKEDGLIQLDADPLVNISKIRAYDSWPGTYFFVEHNGKQIRVRITEAHIAGDKLSIDRVTPEGKKEMGYDDFKRGLK